MPDVDRRVLGLGQVQSGQSLPFARATHIMATPSLAEVLWSGATYALIGVVVAAAIHGVVVMLRGGSSGESPTE